MLQNYYQQSSVDIFKHTLMVGIYDARNLSKICLILLPLSNDGVCSLRVILALGISMTFINIPVEWFSVGFNWTWMLLFGDIRQGIFYSMLLSFWIIFCGEHLMVLYTAPLNLMFDTFDVFLTDLQACLLTAFSHTVITANLGQVNGNER